MERYGLPRQSYNALSCSSMGQISLAATNGRPSSMLPHQCQCSCMLAVLVGAVPPLMLQSETNPEGTPLAALDAIRKGM
jgi:hypothetical protein